MDRTETGRKSTGVGKLDELMEGGFKEDSVNLLEGDPGSGKSTFALQYLLAGVKAGERGVYISVEETKKSFTHNMARFGYNIEEYENAGNFLFFECTSQKMKDFLDKGSLGIEQEIIQMQAKRIVLDSISAFVLNYENESKQRTAVQRLFEKLKSWNVTTLIVSESSQDYTPFGLTYIVDGWIKLYYKKVGQERVRTLEVLKMRGTKHKTTETVYRIEDTGINLYPNERVFHDMA
ncbi:MAG: ATPase domain-containing protein [Candidatus Altiarchaeota archaeon]